MGAADEGSLSFRVSQLSLGVSSVNCPPKSSEISKITSQLHQPHPSKNLSFLLLANYSYQNIEGFSPSLLCRTPANFLEWFEPKPVQRNEDNQCAVECSASDSAIQNCRQFEMRYQCHFDQIQNINLPQMLLVTRLMASRFLVFAPAYSSSKESSKGKEESPKDMCERAVWASKFINLIASEKPSASVSAPSLRDILLTSTIDPKACQGFSKEEPSESIKEEMKDMFIGGVVLEQGIYQQERTTEGKNFGLTEQQTPINKQDKRFAFLPSFLVTQPIFKTIQNMQRLYTLYYGNYGIGKTHSFILYQRLSNIISEFVFKNMESQSRIEQIQKMKKAGLLVQSPRKVIYLNLNDAINIYQEINASIQLQCPELDFSSISKKVSKKKQFEEKLSILRNSYINKQTKLVLIVDQINQVVSLFRKWNENLSIIPMIKRPKELPANLNTFEDIIKQIKNRQIKIIYNSSLNIEVGIINGKENVVKGYRRLVLGDGHEPIKKIQLPYRTNLLSEWGQASFKHYLWEEVALRIRLASQAGPSLFSTKLSKEMERYLRLLFTIALGEAECPIYLRFLNIRSCGFDFKKILVIASDIANSPPQLFRENESKLKQQSLTEAELSEIAKRIGDELGGTAQQTKAGLVLSSKQDKQKQSGRQSQTAVEESIETANKPKKTGKEQIFLTTVWELWTTVKAHSEEEFLDKIKENLEKSDFRNISIKIGLIFKLLEKAEAVIEERKQQTSKSPAEAIKDNNSFIIHRNELNKNKKQEKYFEYFSENDRNRLGSVDRQFIDYQMSEDKSQVRILYSPETFCRLFDEVFLTYFIDQDQRLGIFSKARLQSYRNNKAGEILELIFLSILDDERLEASYQEVNYKDLGLKPIEELKSNQITFKSLVTDTFHEVREAVFKQTKQKITKSFQKLFDRSRENPSKQIFAVPEINDEWSQNSPSIDFLTVNYIQKTKKFFIRTYDITAAMRDQNIFKKLTKADDIILRCLNEALPPTNDLESVEVSHTVLCHSNKIESINERKRLQNQAKQGQQRQQIQKVQQGQQGQQETEKPWEIKLGAIDKIKVTKSSKMQRFAILREIMQTRQLQKQSVKQ